MPTAVLTLVLSAGERPTVASAAAVRNCEYTCLYMSVYPAHVQYAFVPVSLSEAPNTCSETPIHIESHAVSCSEYHAASLFTVVVPASCL